MFLTGCVSFVQLLGEPAAKFLTFGIKLSSRRSAVYFKYNKRFTLVQLFGTAEKYASVWWNNSTVKRAIEVAPHT